MAGPPFTINTTAPASSDLVSAFPTNEQANRSAILDWLSWCMDPATGVIKDQALPTSVIDIPSGTKMLFVQSTAPTGWAKDTTHNDKALRVVSGTVSSGGSVNFSTVFGAAVVTGSHVLTAGEMPSHTHGVSGTTGTESADHAHNQQGTFSTTTNGAHAHNVPFCTGSTGSGSPTGDGTPNATVQSDTQGSHAHTVTISGQTSGRTAAHTHSFSVTSAAAGSGGGHTHTMAMDIKYVDVIICTRS